MKILRRLLLLFVLLYLLPIGVAAALHMRNGLGAEWSRADRSSADS